LYTHTYTLSLSQTPNHHKTHHIIQLNTTGKIANKDAPHTHLASIRIVTTVFRPPCEREEEKETGEEKERDKDI